jgi:hypothetical protein
MNLPNDIARCDGILPKDTILNGKPALLWSIDCPRRDECARYCQQERDDPDALPGTYRYTAHYHAPAHDCPDFVREKVGGK